MAINAGLDLVSQNLADILHPKVCVEANVLSVEMLLYIVAKNSTLNRTCYTEKRKCQIGLI
jgi:hypothetical protein